ncbi:hypothetical protein PGJ86_13240 [Acinetobacter baumannii]|nr:hypothetical protein [Acinetobacter baumannii]
MIKKIFLLDKNVVSLLDKNNFRIKHKTEIEMLQFIRRHDRKNYAFSAAPSILEGRIRRRENESEIKKTIERENKILQNFLKNAHTDVHLWNDESLNLSFSFSSSQMQSKELQYKELLRTYYKLLIKYQIKGSVPRSSMKDFAYNILWKCERLNLPRIHPNVLILIIDIFQKWDNKEEVNPCNILRPKNKFKSIDEKIHNVYSDLTIHIFLSHSIFLAKETPIQFLTCDGPLKSYVQLFEVSQVMSPIQESSHELEFQHNVSINSQPLKKFILEIFENYDKEKLLGKINYIDSYS